VDLYEKIKLLASEKKMSIRQLEETLGFGNGVINRWRKNTPGSDKLKKVADYFDVSIDYLLGRTENPNFSVSAEKDQVKDKEENELLAAFRMESEDMTEEEKKKFNSSLKGMMKIAKGLLNDDTKWKD
jgi:transcriptional regulator with XRE-family HTH domain